MIDEILSFAGSSLNPEHTDLNLYKINVHHRKMPNPSPFSYL